MLDLDRFLPYRLNVLAKRMSRLLADRYQARFGIGIAEWRVLAILGKQQPLSSNDIVARSRMDKAKVSRAVALLVDRGLVEKAPHPDDSRLLRLSFTAIGQALYDDIAPLALAFERDLLAGMPKGTDKLLDALIERLETRLGEMEELGKG